MGKWKSIEENILGIEDGQKQIKLKDAHSKESDRVILACK